MLVIATSKLVGDRLNSPLYDKHIDLKNIPYLESKLPSSLPSFTVASDIMTSPVVVVPRVVSVGRLLAILASNKHNAYPVIATIDGKDWRNNKVISQGEGRFEGIILRWH